MRPRPTRLRGGQPARQPDARRRPGGAPVRLVPLRGWALASGLALVLGPACKSPEAHARSADAEVYPILTERLAALGNERQFSVDPVPDGLRERLIRGEDQGALEGLDVLECLAIAAENSRSFQDQREALYRAALNLTFERFQFTVIQRGDLGALMTTEGADPDFASLDGGVGFSKLFTTGGMIIFDAGLSFSRSLARGDTWTALSDFSLTITQPLLQDAGWWVNRENLTQAERDVLYQARAYERFRATLAFDVASRLYRILQQEDVLANEEANFANLELVRKRNEALAEAGRLDDIELGQASQNELSARNRVVDARQRLQDLKDDLKLFLGLPIDAPLSFDRSELVRLVERGLDPVELTEDVATATALFHRVDYRTISDQVEDAERAVRIAANQLQARLDVGLTVQGTSASDRPIDFAEDQVSGVLDIDYDSPLNRLAERNLYRASLISLNAARRAMQQFADQIRSDLRDDLRRLEAERQTYEIQSNSVALAERRIASTLLKQEAGRATTRDLLEAQDALVNAQNAASRALVDHTIAALSLYLDMEALTVDEQGLAPDPDIIRAWLEGIP